MKAGGGGFGCAEALPLAGHSSDSVSSKEKLSS